MSSPYEDSGFRRGLGRGRGRGRGRGLGDSVHANPNASPNPQAETLHPNLFINTMNIPQPEGHAEDSVAELPWNHEALVVAHDVHNDLLKQIRAQQAMRDERDAEIRELKAKVQSLVEAGRAVPQEGETTQQESDNAKEELKREIEKGKQKDAKIEESKADAQRLQANVNAAAAETADLVRQMLAVENEVKTAREELQKEKEQTEQSDADNQQLKEKIGTQDTDVQNVRDELRTAKHEIADLEFSIEQIMRICEEDKQALRTKFQDCQQNLEEMQQETRQLKDRLRNQPDLTAAYDNFEKKISELEEERAEVNEKQRLAETDARHFAAELVDKKEQIERLNGQMDEVHRELARKENELGECRDDKRDHADMVWSLEEERSAAVDRARTMLDALRPLVGSFHDIQLHFDVFDALARRAAVAAAARDGRDAAQKRQLPETATPPTDNVTGQSSKSEEKSNPGDDEVLEENGLGGVSVGGSDREKTTQVREKRDAVGRLVLLSLAIWPEASNFPNMTSV